MDTARLLVWAPAVLSPNCLDSLKERQELYIYEKKKSTNPPHTNNSMIHTKRQWAGTEKWNKQPKAQRDEVVWHTSKREGRSSSWSSSRPGTLGNFWNMQLYMVWADVQTESKDKKVVQQLIVPMMKQKEKVVILWYQPGEKMTFRATVSASTNLATALCVFSPSNCLYWTSSWRGLLFLQHALNSLPKLLRNLQKQTKHYRILKSLSSKQTRKPCYSNLCQLWTNIFQLLEPGLNTCVTTKYRFPRSEQSPVRSSLMSVKKKNPSAQ